MTSRNPFTDMQNKRHRADYDPGGRWRKADVEEDIEDAAVAIDEFQAAPFRDRRAFAVYVLLKNRNP